MLLSLTLEPLLHLQLPLLLPQLLRRLLLISWHTPLPGCGRLRSLPPPLRLLIDFGPRRRLGQLIKVLKQPAEEKGQPCLVDSVPLALVQPSHGRR
jgi:hypothetical protein